MLIKRASACSCFPRLLGGVCTPALVKRVCPTLCTNVNPQALFPCLTSSVMPYLKVGASKGARDRERDCGYEMFKPRRYTALLIPDIPFFVLPFFFLQGTL